MFLHSSISAAPSLLSTIPFATFLQAQTNTPPFMARCLRHLVWTHRRTQGNIANILRSGRVIHTKQPPDVREAHGLGYMGPAATTWVPMGAQIPYCHQMITHTHPRGNKRVLEKVSFAKEKKLKCYGTA